MSVQHRQKFISLTRLYFRSNNGFAAFFSVAAAVCHLTFGLQSIGPDISNYQAFQADKLEGHLAVQIYTETAQFLSLGWLLDIEQLVILQFLILSLFISCTVRKPIGPLLAFWCMFFATYEGSLLFGNVLRQGLALTMLMMSLPFALQGKALTVSLVLILLASIIHPGSLIVGAWFFILRHASWLFRIHRLTLSLIACVMVSYLFMSHPYIQLRISLLAERDWREDWTGYAFCAMLFFLISLVSVSQGPSTMRRLALVCGLVILLFFFGEFGQRIIVAISFVSAFLYLLDSRFDLRCRRTVYFCLWVVSGAVGLIFSNNYFLGFEGL